MDVVNVTKDDIAVSIVTFVLPATAFDTIGLRIEFGPCIVYHDVRVVNE